MKPPTYSFPGLWSFISRAAGKRNVRHMDRVQDTWYFQQVQELLVQIPGLDDREAQRKLAYDALKVRESLAVTLRGIDEAIGEVVESFDLYDKE